jgi:hypothetical protein
MFMVMARGMNSAPAYPERIQVTIEKLIFSPIASKAKVGDTTTRIKT